MSLRDEEPLSRHLPLRCGGTVEHWLEVADEAELVAAIKLARSERWNIRPIAAFHDSMPPEGGLVGLGLRLGVGFEQVTALPDGTVEVGAAALLACVGLLPGFAALARAPGTLFDAWEEGWIRPALRSVRRFQGRGITSSEELTADVRSLLVSAVIAPNISLAPPSSGQAFVETKRKTLRDTLRRGQLAGLRVHGAILGDADPAVLANRGDATPRHLRALTAAVRERVQTATGIHLEDRLGPPGRGGRL